MTLSAISHYRGGSIDDVIPFAKRLKAIDLKYGVTYPAVLCVFCGSIFPSLWADRLYETR